MSATRLQNPRRVRTTRRPPPDPPEPAAPGLRPAILPALFLVLVLAALAEMVAGAFTVRKVRVIGANLPAATIVQVAAVLHKNIFRLRPDTVIERLQSLPAVDVTRVDTVFPDTVVIHATLRTPYIAWRAGSITYLVDDTGRILGPAGPTPLPLLTGAPGSQPPDFAVLQAVRYSASTLAGAPGGAIGQMEMDPKLGLVIVGQSGWQAVVGLGDAQTLVTRVTTLAALLQRLHTRGVGLKYADLRYREPYYRTA